MAGNIFAPGEVGDVNLDGRALGADADFAVAAEHDGADVAGRNTIGFNDIDHGCAKLFEVEGDLHAVDFGGVEQALHVLGETEDGGALRLSVAADALEDAGAVMDDVAQDVEGCVFPGDEVAVVPDSGCGLDRHGGSESSFGRAVDGYLSRYRDRRQHVTGEHRLARARGNQIWHFGAAGHFRIAGLKFPGWTRNGELPGYHFAQTEEL